MCIVISDLFDILFSRGFSNGYRISLLKSFRTTDGGNILFVIQLCSMTDCGCILAMVVDGYCWWNEKLLSFWLQLKCAIICWVLTHKRRVIHKNVMCDEEEWEYLKPKFKPAKRIFSRRIKEIILSVPHAPDIEFYLH